jgi:hypothetical protein
LGGREQIGAILFIVGTWVGLIALLTGLGGLAMRAAGLRMAVAGDAVWSFWIGFSLLIAFLQIWHLDLQIDKWAMLPPLTLGAGGLTWNASELRRCWSTAPATERITLTVAFFGLAIWLADRACGPLTFHDMGLYHLGVIRWAQQHPIVPGLVNLHYRLAFNNASLLYVAALDHGWWRGWAFQISSGVLVLMLGLTVAQGLVRWTVGSGPAITALVRSLLIMPIVDVATQHYFSSTITDIPAIALTIVAALGCLELVSARCQKDGLAFLSLCAVCAAAVCVKFSTLVFCAFLGLLGLFAWLRAADVAMRQRLGMTGVGIVLVVLLLGPWMARGIILSGYPLYPSTIGAAPVDWHASEAAVDRVRIETRDWAKWADRPPQDPSSLGWLSTWLEIRILPPWYLWEALTPALLVSVASLALLLRAWGEPAGFWRAGHAAMLLLPCAVALVFWWYAAPDPRFGAQLFWFLAALTGAIAVMAWRLDRNLHTRAAVLVACLAYGSLPIISGSRPFWRSLERGFGLHAPPQVELRKFTTASGLSVWTPVNGNQCWDAPLPCTPYPDARLRLRHPPNLGSGFVLAAENRAPARKPSDLHAKEFPR